jgi:hypothetical protein
VPDLLSSAATWLRDAAALFASQIWEPFITARDFTSVILLVAVVVFAAALVIVVIATVRAVLATVLLIAAIWLVLNEVLGLSADVGVVTLIVGIGWLVAHALDMVPAHERRTRRVPLITRRVRRDGDDDYGDAGDAGDGEPPTRH